MQTLKFRFVKLEVFSKFKDSDRQTFEGFKNISHFTFFNEITRQYNLNLLFLFNNGLNYFHFSQDSSFSQGITFGTADVILINIDHKKTTNTNKTHNEYASLGDLIWLKKKS